MAPANPAPHFFQRYLKIPFHKDSGAAEGDFVEFTADALSLSWSRRKPMP